MEKAESQKVAPSLQFKKILIAKKGINAGITGGGYQCC